MVEAEESKLKNSAYVNDFGDYHTGQGSPDFIGGNFGGFAGVYTSGGGFGDEAPGHPDGEGFSEQGVLLQRQSEERRQVVQIKSVGSGSGGGPCWFVGEVLGCSGIGDGRTGEGTGGFASSGGGLSGGSRLVPGCCNGDASKGGSNSLPPEIVMSQHIRTGGGGHVAWMKE
ncbi:hypothetical protein BVRB_9g213310 [Beta vulgaris subsp. vulgaris]|nr:hypothetical protein BVRB_9g213310 [Beta vulgaris subsp. vulgaris]